MGKKKFVDRVSCRRALLHPFLSIIFIVLRARSRLLEIDGNGEREPNEEKKKRRKKKKTASSQQEKLKVPRVREMPLSKSCSSPSADLCAKFADLQSNKVVPRA